MSNRNKIELIFPAESGCVLTPIVEGRCLAELARLPFSTCSCEPHVHCGSMEFHDAASTLVQVFGVAAGPHRVRPTARDLPVAATDGTKAVNKMESFWIKALHAGFEAAYPADGGQDAVVLSKTKKDKEWGRSEFLHDVTVLKRRSVSSPYKEVPLPVADKILWQVESELSSSGRNVAIDMSKLVAGAAESKLMVVRLPVKQQTEGMKWVSSFIEDIGTGCGGNLFLAFVPCYSATHPHLKLHSIGLGSLPIALFGRSPGHAFETVSLPWLTNKIMS
jgi:hypothetical protein